MKLNKILNARDVIKKELLNQRMSFSLAYKINKIILATDADENFYLEQMKSVFNKYAKKNENGQIIQDTNGNITLIEDKVTDFYKEYNELLNIDVDAAAIDKISLADFTNENLQLSPHQLQQLMPFVKEE